VVAALEPKPTGQNGSDEQEREGEEQYNTESESP
jgi:hypothetical protein